MSIDPSQILHIKGAVKTDLNLTTGAGSKIGVGVDSPDGVIHILHDQPTIVVAESGTNTSVGRLHANNHSLEIQAGLTSSADSKANIVFSSYGGTTKYIEIDGAGGGPRGNVHVNSDLRAPNVYANTLFLENLAIGEVVQGLDEVLNTNNEASNTIYISNATAATSLTTGALRVAGGISTQSNLHADAVYTANLFSTTDELNLSSDVVKLGNKIELGYGNTDNSDHNIGLVMTARQKFWSNVATADLPNPTTNASEFMGYGVSIDRVGDRIVSGAHGSAYAYVFHRDPNTKTWPSTPTTTFTNSTGTANLFGLCPTISKDGTRIFIDETGNDEGGTDIGRLYVYTYENGAWNTTPVDLPGQSASDQMGWSLDCAADGSAVIVGARFNTEGGTSIGRAYIFTETSGNWSTTPFDLPGEQASAEFGLAVAMNDAGDRVAVGSYGYDNGAALSVGKVYVYHRSSGGTWSATPTATFVGPTQTLPRNNYGLGFSLDMNAAGTRFVAGAAVDYAVVYEYDASTSVWKTAPIAEFKGEDYGALGDLFGYNVSINDAGDRISVGSYTGATNDIFEEVNGAWVHAKRLQNQTSNEFFGSGLNASALNGVGDTLVLGAHGNDEAATNNGRVYVFEQVEPSNVAVAYDGHDVLKIGFTSNVVTDTVVDTNTSNLNVEIAGDLTLTGSANVFVSDATAIHANSNVVTEYVRSKKFIKYPRVAMSGATTSGYTVSASGNFGGYNPWEAFDNDNPVGGNTGAGDGWASPIDASNKHYNPATGAFNLTTQHHTGSLQGEWIQIQIPEPIYLHDFVLESRSETNYSADGYDHGYPKTCELYASTDGSTWTSIRGFTTGQKTSSQQHIEQVNAVVAYKYYALVINSIQIVNNTTQVHWTSVGQIELHGVPEYDPDAHGTDVIARSIPSVPNADWLEVYYDGKDYGSMPSTITDKSGNSVTGTPTNVTFDSTWKAFVFDEADDYITFSPGKSGNYVFSVSIWFKSSGAGIETLFTLNGDNTANQGAWLYGSGNDLIFDFSNNAYTCNIGRHIADDQKWHHMCCAYSGDGSASGRDIYLDGVRLHGTVSGTSAGGTLNLTNSTSAQIGAYNHPTLGYIHEFKGSIANFRLFNRALTGDEVWQLYAYQKDYFQVSPDVVTFKGGRLGIGTEEPRRAVLDVEGDTFSRKYNGGRSTFLTWDYLGSRSTSFAQPTNTSGGTVASILDYEFDVPSCYHDLGTTTLKAYVKVDWRGEFNAPWNFLFRLKVYYNDYSSTYTLDSSTPDQSADNRGRGCGVPTISYHSNNDSTPEAASVTSQFTLEQCRVSKGSKIKVELIGVYTDFGGGAATLWTGRTTNATNHLTFEMMTSSFFVALDVV